MKLLQRFGLWTLDKVVIGFVLFMVSLDVSRGFQQLGLDLISCCIVVLVLYTVTIFVANLPLWIFRDAGRWSSKVLGFISALVVILLFPTMLEGFFFFANLFGFVDYVPSMPIRNVLLIALVARTLVSAYLGRKWG